MKKGWKLTVVFLCAAGAAALLPGIGRKPYRNLDAAQIAFAQVRVSPPDKAVEIEDLRELASYLKEVVVYRKDDSCKSYCGQGVTFTLTMADGTQTEIMEFAPFFVIDGVGYQSKHAPCEALNRYANGLIDSDNANVILEEPPSLAVVSDNTSAGAVLGSYSWQKKNADGTSSGVSSDRAQPPTRAELLPLETPEAAAELQFTEAPDLVPEVRCWRAEDWGEAGTESEAVPVSGGTLTLRPGSYIYEITAEWDAADGYGGTASYFISIKRTE